MDEDSVEPVVVMMTQPLVLVVSAQNVEAALATIAFRPDDAGGNEWLR